MLTINTNLSSLIAQGNLQQSTNQLNQAIERMTTGYKINHASDNAANFSISTNMDTKIGAYMVAEDNVMSGLDLVSTANEVISLMEDRASRLSALSIQARNGTYGAQSLEALNAEAGALVSEIMRLYNSTQFNNVNLFNRSSFTLDENLPKAGESGFIDETALISTTAFDESLVPKAKAEYGGFIENPKTYTDAEVAAMTALTDEVTTITNGEKYSISSVDELENLRVLVNGGVDTTGAIFVLGADIDLSSVANWTPIGYYKREFKGEFDGNGHTIKNLKISRTGNDTGLLGWALSSASIKNVNLENVDVKGSTITAGLLSTSDGTSIFNCIVTGNISTTGASVGGINGQGAQIDSCIFEGNITGKGNTGGIVGYTSKEIKNSYSKGSVNGADRTGGLVGHITGMVENCYAKSNVIGTGDLVGGFVGIAYNDLRNCYSIGSVQSTASNVGGFAGTSTASVIDCYAKVDVEGNGDYIAGFIGKSSAAGKIIQNCNATGNVISKSISKYVGGLVGYSDSPIYNCYALGNVDGGEYVGGLIGYSPYYVTENSYSTGDVDASGDYAGGLIGRANNQITDCYSTGSVKGRNNVGGLAGYTSSTITTSYSTGDVVGEKFVGGLVGQVYKVSGTLTYNQCHAYGKANGTDGVGGLLGGAVLTTNGTSFGKINTVDCQAASQGTGSIGGVYQYDSATTTYTLLSTYDKSSMNSGIKEFKIMPTTTTLHLGINGNDSSSLSFDTNFVFDFSPMNSSVDSDEFYNSVNSFVKQLQEKTTILGSVQNRLMSVLDEITIQRDNLVSSLSTIRDADMAEVSSQYIQQQILQQASATLLATANQTPALALQLL